MKLTDKVAIVTGAAKGIGKAIATKFASAGATVVVADILVKEAQKTVDEIKNAGGKAFAFKTDVTNRESVQNLVKSGMPPKRIPLLMLELKLV